LLRIENKEFRDGELPSFIKNTIFHSCKFRGKLPDFHLCEFHDCDLSGTIVRELVECMLFSCNLNHANFSDADVRFSKTNAGSPCTAYGAEWQGVCCTLDCGWFSGIKANEEDAEIFLIMSTLPDTPLRKKLLRGFSPELLRETRRRMKKNFRA